jgi:hypothetical protein
MELFEDAIPKKGVAPMKNIPQYLQVLARQKMD